jgi:hypothetical protein
MRLDNLRQALRQAASDDDLKRAVDELFEYLYSHGKTLVLVSNHVRRDLTLESSKGEKMVTKRDLLEMLGKYV